MVIQACRRSITREGWYSGWNGDTHRKKQGSEEMKAVLQAPEGQLSWPSLRATLFARPLRPMHCCLPCPVPLVFRGDFGRLGHGHSTDVFLPQPVLTLSNRGILQIACGDCHCIAITTEGQMFR